MKTSELVLTYSIQRKIMLNRQLFKLVCTIASLKGCNVAAGTANRMLVNNLVFTDKELNEIEKPKETFYFKRAIERKNKARQLAEIDSETDSEQDESESE